MSKRGKIIIIILVVLFIFAGGIRILFPPKQTSDSQNNSTNSTSNSASNSNSFSIPSYPISYSQSDLDKWDQESTITPIDSNLHKDISQATDCTDITAGMSIYYNDDLSSIMIATNSSILTSYNQQQNYDLAVNFIEDPSIVPANADMQIFKIYCTTFQTSFVENLNAYYPNTEASRTIVAVGSTEQQPTDSKNVNIYIYTYAKRGRNLIMLSKILRSDSLLSDIQCSGSLLTCIENELQNSQRTSRLTEEAQNLITTFQLNQ